VTERQENNIKNRIQVFKEKYIVVSGEKEGKRQNDSMASEFT